MVQSKMRDLPASVVDLLAESGFTALVRPCHKFSRASSVMVLVRGLTGQKRERPTTLPAGR